MMSLPTLSRAFGELFGKAKDSLTKIQTKMASILPSMPGQDVGKFYDLAIGIDIHATTWPPLPVCPVPHIGMVFDLMAVIVSAVASQLPDPTPPAADGTPAPFSLGDAACNLVKGMAPSVKVHGQWVANAGIPIIHLPAFILHPLPVVAPFAESEMWMGSSTVLADGSPCSTRFHPALSCNSIGFPAPPRKPGLFKAPKKTLQAPTSLLSIITSSGKPVLVGGPPTIDLFQLLVKIGIKCLGKLWSKTKLSKALSEWFQNTPLGKLKQKMDCFLFGEPVDAATGRVFHENIDFELPGPIPISWSRTYYSDAEVDGPLGYNWHHSYNISIREMENYVILRLPEGREIALPALEIGETHYDRSEKITLSKDKYGYYYEDSSRYIYRFGSIKNKAQYNTLSKISTKDGFEVQFNYTSQGELIQILDSRENKIYVKSDVQGRVTAVYIAENENQTYLVRYKYDDNGNMIETQDALDVTKYFAYEGHLLTKLTNQSGLSFHWEYEGKRDNAKCIHTWGDNGVLEYWTQYRDGFTKTRNGLGQETIYFYDKNNLVYKIIDANGGITHQKYNLDGELEIVTNPEGYTTKRKYDEYGNVIQFINENEESTHYSYDENKNLIHVTTPGGRSISWKYDHLGRITEKTTSAGDKLVYTYDGPLLSSITNTSGKNFKLEYNRSYDLEKLTLPNGLYKEWKFDNRGRVTQVRDINGNSTTFEYNKLDNVTQLTLPDGNVHHFEYDKSQNLIHAKDNLHDVVFEYGAMGTLLKRTQQGKSVQFKYNKELQLKSIFNEGREKYEFELDALGQVIGEIGFDGLRRDYLRDGIGRVTKVLRPAERWTEYMYDGTGNVVHELQYDELETAYHYNSDGMLIEALNKEGLIQLKRDRNGRIIQEYQGQHTINRSYDKQGQCIHIGSSLGADIHQEYDDQGNLISLKSADHWQADWKRDDLGLELHRQLTGGVSIRTERDRFGRETRKTIGVRNSEQSCKQYLWGMGNRLQGIHDELRGTYINFDYDDFDNLVKADYTDFGKQTETIYRAPDAIGNLYQDKNRKDRKYAKGGRLLEDPNYFYHYDVEGNLCFKEFKKNQGFDSTGKEALEKKYKIKFQGSATGWLYHWASNGMLMKVVNPQQGKVYFGYDPLGRRTYKETKKKRTNWLWDSNVPLHEWETHSTESLINVVTWIFEGGFVPCAKVTQDNSYSIVTDYLGTPTQMFDNEGANIWEAELDIYGKVRTFKGGSISDCPFRYQGQYLDNETGLYYNRFRYYDPEIGNYISQDPIGLNGDNPTLYGYVHNPNKSVDYLGLDVYELTAGVDGWYPVYEKGSLNPIAYERLDAGDTYKIGESINSSKRYSQTALDEARINRSKATSVAVDSNGKVMLDVNGKPIPAGLDMNKVDVGGTKIADRKMETDMITDYEDNNNKLPAGNKTHH